MKTKKYNNNELQFIRKLVFIMLGIYLLCGLFCFMILILSIFDENYINYLHNYKNILQFIFKIPKIIAYK